MKPTLKLQFTGVRLMAAEWERQRKNGINKCNENPKTFLISSASMMLCLDGYNRITVTLSSATARQEGTICCM